MPTKIDLTGRRFGRLTVVAPDGKRGGAILWACTCDCGGSATFAAGVLNAGRRVNCGCYRAKPKPYVLKRVRFPRAEYNVWRKMLDRCGNEKTKGYERYGGRGIKVCDRWAKFENFLADMGLRPNGMTLDREDNDGNYEPNNCRWATAVEQNRNKRTNRVVELDGKTQCVAAWCEELGIRRGAVYTRLNLGWSAEDALTTPIREKSPTSGPLPHN